MVACLDRIDPVAAGSVAGTLDAIADPHVALAIWYRTIAGTLTAALAGLDLDRIEDVVAALAVDDLATVDALLRTAGYPDDVAAALGIDIALLAQGHAARAGARALALRLEVVETDACRRFHADYVTLRLLCTYLGPGTQWCRADAADRVAELPTGAVGVFKGKLLLDPPTILHRSPPIAGTGERRLMLAIDPVVED